MVNKPKRRTHWQAVAARKYRRMLFLGGDGGPTECRPYEVPAIRTPPCRVGLQPATRPTVRRAAVLQVEYQQMRSTV